MAKFRTGVLVGLALLASPLLTAPASAEKGLNDPVPSGDKAFTTRLSEALSAQGWTPLAADSSSVSDSSPPPKSEVSVAELEPAEAPDNSPAALLRETLERRAWTAHPTEDGSVIYQPPATAEQFTAPKPPAQGAPAEHLREALEGQGWTALPAEDGGVYYLPPEREQRAEPTLADRLKASLEQQGWVSSTTEDGSAIYQPPAAEVEKPEPATTAKESLAGRLRETLEHQGWSAAPAEDGGVYYLPPERAPSVEPTLADRLKASLEQQGWVSSTAEDGSLIYQSPTAAPVTAGASVASGFAQDFRQNLERDGWQAQPAEDGSIFMVKPQPEEAVDVERLESPPPSSSEETGSTEPGTERAVSATSVPRAGSEQSSDAVGSRQERPRSMRRRGHPNYPYNTWRRPYGRSFQPTVPRAPGWGAPPQWQQAPGWGRSPWGQRQRGPYGYQRNIRP